MPAPTRFACAPATAASFPFPIRAPAAAPTAWRKFAGPCARTPTWRSTPSRSAGRSRRPFPRPASPYANLPNAGKFQQTYDPTCSCRRKGESWAEALADAEARYGHEKHDIIVTPEKSAEMARPIVDPKAKPAMDPKAKPGRRRRAGPRRRRRRRRPADAANAPVLDANGADTKLSAEAATVSREASGIAGDDAQSAKSFTVKQGQTVGSHRPRRRQTEGADSRANALARPISGRSAASSGPASRPVSARRRG